MAVNQLKTGAVLNYVIIGLHILTGLLYTPFMLRSLGRNEYGLYSLVASVITYLTLLDFGFGSAIVRYTAKIRVTGTKEQEWSLYGMFLSSYAILGMIVTIGGVILYLNTDRLFDRAMTPDELAQARTMMGLMVFNLAITFPFSVFGSIITAYERFVFKRILSISRILLSTAVLITVLLLGYKAIGLVVVQTVFSICTLLTNLLYCKFKLKIKITFRNFNFLILREIMMFSFWNFISAIVDRIYWSSGQFILGMYCGTTMVAIYSLAIMLMNLYISMSTSLNSVLLPRLTAMATKYDNDQEISDLFIKTGRLQFCILALILSGFIVLGKQFITLWAGADYHESYIITLIFFLALLCPLIQNVGITILLARGQQKFRSLTYLAIASVCLASEVWLAKKLGAIGCAIAVGTTLLLGQWFIMNIYYKVRQRLDILKFWKQIIKMAIMPCIMTVGGFLIVQRIPVTNWLTFMLTGIVFVTIYLPLFYKYSMNTYERVTIMNPLIKAMQKISHTS